MVAVSVGNEEIISMLLEAGANMMAQQPPNDMTPLHLAAAKNLVNVCILLVGAGALLESYTAAGST